MRLLCIACMTSGLVAAAEACSTRDGDTAGSVLRIFWFTVALWLGGVLLSLLGYRFEPGSKYVAPKIALGCVLPPFFVILNPSADCGSGPALLTIILLAGQLIMFYGIVVRFLYAKRLARIDET